MKNTITLLLLMVATMHAAVKAPTTADIIKQFSDVSLEQENGWECGYVALFHTLKLRAAIACKAVESMGEEDYDAWFDEVLENDDTLADKRDEESDKDKYLSTSDIHRVLRTTLGEQKIPDDIMVFEDKNTALPLPHDSVLLDQINQFNKKFKGTDKPFFIIACDATDMHWVAVILHDGKCIDIDSLPGRKRSVVSKIQKIFYESKLPTGDDYTTVANNIKKNIKKKKKMVPVKNDAIKNYGFTKETFEALVKKIKHDRKSKGSHTVIEVDDSDDDVDSDVIVVD